MDLVTGSTGFLGNVLIRELLSRGHKVRAFHRPESDTSMLDGLDIEKSTGDILDLESLKKAFNGVDTVYHLASVISIMPGRDRKLVRCNHEGTKNVIEACIACGVKKLIYTSSIHALKEPPEGVTIDEKCSYDPDCRMGEYDRSKARASLDVIESGKKGLHTVILCPTGIMGPYNWKISSITRMFIDYHNGNMNMGIHGAYDFVDVRDVAAGHILAAEKAPSGAQYILSGQRVTIRDIFVMLEEITGIKAPSIYIPTGLARFYFLFTPIYYRIFKKTPIYTTYSLNTLQSNSFISSAKAIEELGYEARSIKESIEDTFSWLSDSGLI